MEKIVILGFGRKERLEREEQFSGFVFTVDIYRL
jgi:hypothetical protein